MESLDDLSFRLPVTSQVVLHLVHIRQLAVGGVRGTRLLIMGGSAGLATRQYSILYQ